MSEPLLSGRDPWYFPRTDFAHRIVAMADLMPAARLYSPRRTGKTWFVTHDLIPVAESKGYHPVLIDLWQNAQDCAQALVNGFRGAVEDITIATSRSGRTLNQRVTAIRGMGFGLNLDSPDQPLPPPDVLSQIRFWLDALVRVSDKPLYLVFDEIQQIALAPNAFDVAAALRSALQAHSHGVAQFFTGSSQDQLARLFVDSNAPFYQYGNQLELPPLREDFVAHIAEHFEARLTHLHLDRAALWRAFGTLDYKPGPFREMLNKMVYANSADIPTYLAAQQHVEDKRAQKLLESRSLKPIEMAIAARVAHGLTTTGIGARRAVARITRDAKKEIPIGTAQRALDRLREAGIVYRTEHQGQYRITASALAEHIRITVPLADISDET